MFSVPHLIVLFIVALIVFGPEKLPELARNLGRWTAEFKRATGDLRSTFEDHMRELERETSERKIGGNTAPKLPAATNATAARPADAAPSAATYAEAAEPKSAQEAGQSGASEVTGAPGAVTAEPPYLSRSGGPTTGTTASASEAPADAAHEGAIDTTRGAPTRDEASEKISVKSQPDSETAGDDGKHSS